jgi:hypothetical protein
LKTWQKKKQKRPFLQTDNGRTQAKWKYGRLDMITLFGGSATRALPSSIPALPDYSGFALEIVDKIDGGLQ